MLLPGTLFALLRRVPNRPIPAVVNLESGSGQDARAALVAAGAFDVEACEPAALARQTDRAIAVGTARVVRHTALAIVPGGTLNHFARDHGIPTDKTEAAELSASGATTTTDVATLNGRVFLNTSSVGAYVVFVRTRERLERRLGYRL